jgi:hypothetical protein
MSYFGLKTVKTEDFFKCVVDELKQGQTDLNLNHKFQPFINKSGSLVFDGKNLFYYNELMLTVEILSYNNLNFSSINTIIRIYPNNRLYKFYYNKLNNLLSIRGGYNTSIKNEMPKKTSYNPARNYHLLSRNKNLF